MIMIFGVLVRKSIKIHIMRFTQVLESKVSEVITIRSISSSHVGDSVFNPNKLLVILC
jgi:hypothetical protein